jgi:predicted amidohydrolase
VKICAAQLNLKKCSSNESFYNYLNNEVFRNISNDTDLIVFPENINLSLLFVKRPKLSLSFKTIFETIFDKFISAINLSFLLKNEDLEYQKEIILNAFSKLAKKYNVNIITGSFYEKTKDGIYNIIYAIDRNGNIIDKAVKKDLVGFEKALKMKSKAENKVVNFDFAKVGMCICFDLNDPKYIEKFNCEILVAPSNGYRPFPGYPFDYKKETPQIQRAQENNFCIIRPYCAGWLGPLYFQGHTMIVDKFGNVIGKAKSKDKTELVFVVI